MIYINHRVFEHLHTAIASVELACDTNSTRPCFVSPVVSPKGFPKQINIKMNNNITSFSNFIDDC